MSQSRPFWPFVGSLALLLGSGLQAQSKGPPPPPPRFADHGNLLSSIPESSNFEYAWKCSHDPLRRIAFEISYASPQPQRPDGTYYLAPRWNIEGYSVGDSIESTDELKKLDEFVGSLQAVLYVAGRCFTDGAEIRIGGFTQPDAGAERVDAIFRVP